MRRTILTLALIASTASAMAQTPPPPPPAGPIGAPMRGPGGVMLMRADADHDGTITREEAMAQADMRFDRIDANRDGAVTQDEMRDARMAMRTALRDRANVDGAISPPPPGKRPDRGSGGPVEMTREASRARAMAAFDRADANRDGRIDSAEMAQVRDAWRDRRDARGDMPPPAPQQ